MSINLLTNPIIIDCLPKYLTKKETARLACVNKTCSSRYNTLCRGFPKSPATLPLLQRFIWNPHYLILPGKKISSLKIQCLRMTQQLYNKPPRPASDNRFGTVFPIYPEIIYRGIQLSKNENVLELAAGDGINAVLLAPQARHVFVNDLCPEELRKFDKIKSSFPKHLQEKMTAIRANCFDLMKNPKLKSKIGSFGFILCRNFFHFVHPRNQNKFLRLVKTLLRPGGRAIFTVNAIHKMGIREEDLDQTPQCVFPRTFSNLTDYATRKFTMLYSTCVPQKSFPSQDAIFTRFQSVDLYIKDSTTRFKWVAYKEAFKKLDPKLQKKLLPVIKKEKQRMLRMPFGGSVRVVSTYHRLFSIKKLASIFLKAGFNVKSTFGIKNNCHITSDPQKSRFVGIEIENPTKVSAIQFDDIKKKKEKS